MDPVNVSDTIFRCELIHVYIRFKQCKPEMTEIWAENFCVYLAGLDKRKN